MKRFLFAGLCALAAGLGGAGSADAQCCLGSPYGCGAICAHMFPFMHHHGPLYNYGNGCGDPGCGAGGCGHGGHGGHWGPWNHSAGCHTGLFGGAGFGRHGHDGAGCDSCGSSGWGHYARTTFVNVFARLHPTANKCGHTCGVFGGRSAGGCHTCGGHGLAGGCGTFGSHAGGGLLGRLHGAGGGCGHGGCGLGGGHGGGGGGGGLQTGPWYLYWPTADNQFQVPGPNAAGWRGNHFVLPAPYGGYAQAGGANPYFPAGYAPGR